MNTPICQAVIFDLDGTLLDTLGDIAGAANRVLAAKGFAPHPQDAYRWFVGDGSKVLMTRALPADRRTPELIDACLGAFIADYNDNWDRATRPYDGILDLIDALEAGHIPMAVVTNKPHQFAGLMMARYFNGRPFDPILGQRDDIPHKPDPQQALAAAAKMGIAPARCVFLGDSAVDMQTAQGAGMQGVGAAWGFRTKKELMAAGAAAVIDHPHALLAWLACR
jgi:phosphoglycolate phosphatase